MTAKEEKAYVLGMRAAWATLLSVALRNLGYDSPEAKKHKWIVEREEAIAALRSRCAENGDNDWPDNLSLADIINKHLGETS